MSAVSFIAVGSGAALGAGVAGLGAGCGSLGTATAPLILELPIVVTMIGLLVPLSSVSLHC